jgi:ATP-dependent Clp protease ATP-binding subunit ClpC
MFEYFTEKAIAVILAAQEEARRIGQSAVGTESLLLGLVRVEGAIAATVLAEAGINLSTARQQVEAIVGRGSGYMPTDLPFTPKTKQVLEEAVEQARQMDQPYVSTEHILLSLIEHDDCVAVKIMMDLGTDLGQLRTQVIQAINESAPVIAGTIQPEMNMGRSRSTSSSALTEYGTDLTQMASEGKLDPMVGRQPELERVVQILGRRTKNNPVLVGEPGVGKTAIAEGLAQRIVEQTVPHTLLDKQVVSLDMGTLIAGTRFRGEFEERLTQIIREVVESSNVILVIDEIHTLVGAGGNEGGMDAANLLKPALARGQFQVIGATTLDEYRQHIERDAALERRFQPVLVGEPTVEETVEILRGLRDRYEQHHRVQFTPDALTAAATLSDRYIMDRFLPDKAIDLLDEAGSLVHLRQYQSSPLKAVKQELRQVRATKEEAVAQQDFESAGKWRDRELELEQQLQIEIATAEVTSTDIAQVLSAWTNIPVVKLTESESLMLMHLEDVLHERVIGQTEAVTAVAKAVRRSRIGLNSPNRPIASFLFSGPTGVGKTELAKALAASVFGSESAMIRLDMSEYMEAHTVAKLIGSPPGYVGYGEGGQLTEAVRRQPYSVILLDEVEKAHPDVFNTLLQLLDDGQLTDSSGRKVSFKNTIVIMTSNLGSRAIEKGGAGLGFDLAEADSQYAQIRDRVLDELKAFFRPEFLNRIDELIVFRQLQRSEIERIADLQLDEVAARLSQQAIALDVTDAFKAKVIVEGYDPRYGARPLRRAIARLLEDALAEAILSGQIKAGDRAIADVDQDGQVTVERQREMAIA